MEDKDIVDLYWKRDENAIKLTQEKYEKYLMKIAVNILGDYQESEQSVNDTYLAAWNSMPDNRPDILSVYLGKITRRISISIHRMKNRIKRGGSEFDLSYEELSDCMADKNSPGDELEAKELEREIVSFALNSGLSRFTLKNIPLMEIVSSFVSLFLVYMTNASTSRISIFLSD